MSLFIALLGAYMGSILFGANSLEVLIRLKRENQHLNSEIKALTKKNEDLQKQYFELLELQPRKNTKENK